MLNKLLAWVRKTGMIRPGDRIVCAVSGGADSVAMLFALYLLKEKLGITLEAAHFNHCLRGAESDRDEAFVRSLADRYDIPLHVGRGTVTAGKKGLEAAARDTRYRFLSGLPGKIATAHTADDNAETLLLHLIRGTGLKGLGGIAPVRGSIIRPMLTVTRQEVLAFLDEWKLQHVEDSSNGTDRFLRNRVRHDILPLLARENPRIAQSLSRTALRLREDELALQEQCDFTQMPTIPQLRSLPPAIRSRVLERFLKDNGVREPEDSHIALVEALVFSDRPSARANLPGPVTVARSYERLVCLPPSQREEQVALPCPGEVTYGRWRVVCTPASHIQNTERVFTVCPEGPMLLRPRQPGDAITLPGGTKSLKKLFIDRKIPADCRGSIPVLCDQAGILAVADIGVNQLRAAKMLPACTILFENI